MTNPEVIVPTNPDSKISESTSVREVILSIVPEIASPGEVKNSLNLLSLTIIEITNGYKIAINHVLLNNIFKINAIPKKMTKYKSTETNS